ncbi:MAG: SRPBCC family protein [Polyangiaceae bacterium]
MAGEEFVEVERVFDHPIERVFERYTDHEDWTRWAGFGRVTLAREGTPVRHGLGSVRAFSAAPGLHEEVTRFEPPRLQEYTVTAGPVPFSAHHGVVKFESEGKGTRIRWRVSFIPKLPGTGWLLRTTLSLLFRRLLKRFARHLDSVYR